MCLDYFLRLDSIFSEQSGICGLIQSAWLLPSGKTFEVALRPPTHFMMTLFLKIPLKLLLCHSHSKAQLLSPILLLPSDSYFWPLQYLTASHFPPKVHVHSHRSTFIHAASKLPIFTCESFLAVIESTSSVNSLPSSKTVRLVKLYAELYTEFNDFTKNKHFLSFQVPICCHFRAIYTP